VLEQAQIVPSLPVVDLGRAVKFYHEKLGLKIIQQDKPEVEWGGAVVEGAGGARIYLYKRGATKADHTVLNFGVKDFDAAFKSLKDSGVKFEEYDMPGLKTINGVATWDGMKSAWFKDTEGNSLGLSNMVI
jgi:predicted enzyme related to lactoylglutathione lyase